MAKIRRWSGPGVRSTRGPWIGVEGSIVRRSTMSLLAALVAPGAMLTASAAEPEAGLEEIVVTAQKREQDINEVGITINAFTAEKLDDFGVRSSEDLESLVPGLTISNAQPNGVPVYTIRGVGFADFTTSASSTVGIYFDEVNIPYAVMSRGALLDMERLEVLKGPQGDLYGRNTTAGQINFVSRKPTDELQAQLTFDYARFDVIDVEGYVSGRITDSVRGRVAARVIQSAGDGWQRSISRPGDRLGERDEWAVRGLFDIDLGENASLLLNLHYFDDNSENQAGTAFDGTTIGNPGQVFLGGAGPVNFADGNNRLAEWGEDFRPGRNNSLKGVSGKLDWKIGRFDLVAITAYDEFDRDETFNTSGVAFEDADITNDTGLKVFSQELRLSGIEEDLGLYWVVGAYYSHDDLKENYFFGMDESFFALALGINEIETRYSQETETVAGFAHAEWEFIERWKLTLGARYTEEDRQWTGCTFDTGDGSLAGAWNFILTPFVIIPSGFPDPGPNVPGGCGIYNDIPGSAGFGQFGEFSDTISTNKWMWKVGVDFKPTEDMLAYGTISKGFKSGGFNGAAAQLHSQLIPYGPEELLAYELGIKSTWLGGALQLNVSGFYYDYQDKQEATVAVTPVGNISGLTNVPESEVLGAEVEFHWRAWEGLSFDVGAAYIDTEITEYDAIDAALSVYPTVVTFDASGTELANAPNWQANGTVTYEWYLANGWKMMVASDVSYKGSNDGTDIQDPIPSYMLVNARAGVSSADGKWSATLWGRNVFDDDYWLSSSTSNCCFVRLYGQPATYGVTVSYSFF